MIRGGAKWAEEASTLPAADVWALPEHKSDETRRESCKHADAAAFQPTHIIMLHHGRARERARARSKSCQSGGGQWVSQWLLLIISLRGATRPETCSVGLLCLQAGN